MSPDKNDDHQTITYRSFKHFDESCFLNELSTVPWEIIENFETVDDILSVWTLLFTEILDKHAPIKNHRIKRKYQPEWLTSEILDLMKERNKQKLNGNNDAYKALQNKVSALIDIAKKETYGNKIEEGKSDPRTIWKLFREFGLKYNDCNNSKFSWNFQQLFY